MVGTSHCFEPRTTAFACALAEPCCLICALYGSVLVGTGRFELPTCRLGGDRSIHLSYVPIVLNCSRGPVLQTFPANVATVVHPIELNPFHGRVCVRDGLREIAS